MRERTRELTEGEKSGLLSTLMELSEKFPGKYFSYTNVATAFKRGGGNYLPPNASEYLEELSNEFLLRRTTESGRIKYRWMSEQANPNL